MGYIQYLVKNQEQKPKKTLTNSNFIERAYNRQ